MITNENQTRFAVECDDRKPGRYAKVHIEGCRDLKDPESLGTDYVAGYIKLWGREPEADEISPCATSVIKVA